MADQSMGSGISGDISARLLHHAVRILNENNTTSSTTVGMNSSAKFNPSMAIIIIVLISAFLFMGFFSIYVRRCTRSDDNANQNSSQQAARNGGSNANRPTQGLEKEVVEALPLVGYPLVKGLEGGKDLTECAVCLSDFDEDEDVRVLPKCGHVFHQDCIDMWFHSHSTCPLCRASLVPVEGKEGVEGESHTTEDLQNWVSSRGTGPNGETFTIHDGPPVPPNGSILELLSRDGADRILAESLRRDGPLDAGLARREGEDENAERAAGIRALNRTLSRNSSSIRRASRGLEAGDRIDAAATGSARFNSSSVVINVDGNVAGRDNRKPRSMGSSHSFNMTLLRSSSAGSSGRYLRQYFGVQDETDGFRSKPLGSEHKLPVANTRIRRERSANELLNEEAPMWEDVDLNADTGAGVNATRTPASSTPIVPGGLPFERWASRGRKFFSAELPGPAAKRMDSSGEASGPFHVIQKEREPQVEERTKSERWNFGQSFRRTFSLKRTTSNTSDVESSSQQGSSSNKSFYSQPGSSAASKPKKFSPWAGAMKIRRTTSAGGDGLASPHSPSAMAFPESLPVESFPLSHSVDTFPESHPVPSEQQQQHQHQDDSPPKEDRITIQTQP